MCRDLEEKRGGTAWRRLVHVSRWDRIVLSSGIMFQTRIHTKRLSYTPPFDLFVNLANISLAIFYNPGSELTKVKTVSNESRWETCVVYRIMRKLHEIEPCKFHLVLLQCFSANFLAVLKFIFPRSLPERSWISHLTFGFWFFYLYIIKQLTCRKNSNMDYI